MVFGDKRWLRPCHRMIHVCTSRCEMVASAGNRASDGQYLNWLFSGRFWRLHACMPVKSEGLGRGWSATGRRRRRAGPALANRIVFIVGGFVSRLCHRKWGKKSGGSKWQGRTFAVATRRLGPHHLVIISAYFVLFFLFPTYFCAYPLLHNQSPHVDPTPPPTHRRQAHRPPRPRRAQGLFRQRAYLPLMAPLLRRPRWPRRRPAQLR